MLASSQLEIIFLVSNLNHPMQLDQDMKNLMFFLKKPDFFSLILHSKSTYFWFFQTYGTDKNLVK